MTEILEQATIENVQQPVQDEPLSAHVTRAMERYFANLDGEDPSNLYDIVIAEIEDPLLRAVMNYCKSNQSKAARLLGISRGTLRKKLKIYGLL